MPKVIVFWTGGGYEMQVEGVSSRTRVEQLKMTARRISTATSIFQLTLNGEKIKWIQG